MRTVKTILCRWKWIKLQSVVYVYTIPTAKIEKAENDEGVKFWKWKGLHSTEKLLAKCLKYL